MTIARNTQRGGHGGQFGRQLLRCRFTFLPTAFVTLRSDTAKSVFVIVLYCIARLRRCLLRCGWITSSVEKRTRTAHVVVGMTHTELKLLLVTLRVLAVQQL